MKKLLTVLLLSVCYLIAPGQEKFKYGRISPQELQMEIYPVDSSASAVVLYEDINVQYTFSNSAEISRYYTIRIKVLDNDGASYADVSIPYYDSPNYKVNISGLDAAAYNLEDDKVVKSPLKNQYIFREKTSEYGRLLKFSIPNVRAGTVIEYKYVVRTNHVRAIPEINIQREIPVIYSQAEYIIPSYFVFNTYTRGYQKIDLNNETITQSYPIGKGNIVTTKAAKITCVAKDIPALKDDPYVWDVDDFRTRVSFEISAFNFPGSGYEPLSTSWADVNKLLDESDFSRWLKISNPLKEETEKIKNSDSDPLSKIRSALKLVQSKVAWNKRYSLVGESPRSALRAAEGSSSQLNFLLLCVLKDLGYDVKPVLMNPRSQGRIPYTQATIDNISTFIVMADTPEGERVWLDATDPQNDINVFSSNLMVDRARIYGIDSDEGWVDITAVADNRLRTNIMAKLDSEGVITGSVREVAYGLPAMRFRSRFSNLSRQESFIEETEETEGLSVVRFETFGLDSLSPRYDYDFEMSPYGTSDRYYINAGILQFMSKNPFREQERVLPLELEHPYNYEIVAVLDIPEGYLFEEVPENTSMSCCDNAVRFTYISQTVQNIFSVRIRLSLNRIVFAPEEYSEISTFFGLVTEKSNSKIVIKKI